MTSLLFLFLGGLVGAGTIIIWAACKAAADYDRQMDDYFRHHQAKP